MYLFIYRSINHCIVIKLCINYFKYLKYLYKKIKIFVITF